MTKPFKMVRNDLLPNVMATLKWKDGTLVDLTIAIGVQFHMLDPKGLIAINEPATIVEPKIDGKVQYNWQDARDGKLRDTDHLGKCKAEFEVTFSDGQTLTFPTEGGFYILFREEYA